MAIAALRFIVHKRHYLPARPGFRQRILRITALSYRPSWHEGAQLLSGKVPAYSTGEDLKEMSYLMAVVC